MSTPGVVLRKCEIEGCEDKHDAKGLCSKHRQRLRKYGDPHFVKHPQLGGTKGKRIAEGKHGTYNQVHRRMYRWYGDAKDFDCSVCYEPASTWALIKEWVPEEDLLWDKENGFDVPYSIDPAHYLTLCKRHHTKLDCGGLSV